MLGMRPLLMCAGLLFFASPLAAQAVCDDDGGACDDADGGVDPDDDGGVPVDDVVPDGGAAPDAGTRGRYDECSCEADIGTDDGRIHVCTESFDPFVCEDFGCNRGVVRGRACDRGSVALCCEMRSRDLKTHLYEDCDHPNCESGFREQCQRFGGSVVEGPCDAPERPDTIDNTPDDDEDDGGFCTVSAPGAAGGGAGGGGAWLALLVVAGWLARRRR